MELLRENATAGAEEEFLFASPATRTGSKIRARNPRGDARVIRIERVQRNSPPKRGGPYRRAGR
jgi:hypothetical protein